MIYQQQSLQPLLGIPVAKTKFCGIKPSLEAKEIASNYDIAIYKSSVFAVGGKQIAFSKDKSSLIKKFDLLNFYNLI